MNYITEAKERCNYSIRVMTDKSEYYNWCRDHLKAGTWYMKFGIMGNSATYLFENEQDVTAFKLATGCS